MRYFLIIVEYSKTQEYAFQKHFLFFTVNYLFVKYKPNVLFFLKGELSPFTSYSRVSPKSASQRLLDCDQREGIKKISDDKNSPKINDSEADPGARKNPDEKYYFFVEKS